MNSHSKDEDGRISQEGKKNTKANHTSGLKKNNDILQGHSPPPGTLSP